MERALRATKVNHAPFDRCGSMPQPQGVAVLFFEDLQVGDTTATKALTVDHDELVDFANRWDPLPIHVDPAAADAAFGPGGITAPSSFIMAIRTRLIHQFPEPNLNSAVIAAGGWDEVRFNAPVRAGDTLLLQQEILTRRESASKPDRGIVTNRLSLINQEGTTVMSHVDTIIVRRRVPGASSA
jgi:acyl dehydratase